MTDFSPILPHIPSASPFIIAGPCSAESRQQMLDTANALNLINIPVFRAGIWKPRTHPGGFEGVGAIGLEWLEDVKEATGMLTATEVANAEHVRLALRHNIDILWIGARTTTNPFAVQDIADAIFASGRDVAVLVKNPLNPDIELWIGALQRIYNAGVRRIAAIHRGFSSYGHNTYRNEPIWRIPLELVRRYPELPLISDPSHISGKAELVQHLAQQAIDMGFNGLIIECHISPDNALSDGQQQITPDQLNDLLSNLHFENSNNHSRETLELLRREIDRLDADIFQLLDRRMDISRLIAKYKKENHIPIVQPTRFDNIVKSRMETATQLNMNPDFARSLMALIHEESVRQQLNTFRNKP